MSWKRGCTSTAPDDRQRIRRDVHALRQEQANALAVARHAPDRIDDRVARLWSRLEVAERPFDADLAEPARGHQAPTQPPDRGDRLAPSRTRSAGRCLPSAPPTMRAQGAVRFAKTRGNHRAMQASIHSGTVRAHRPLRIAMVAPPWISIPAPTYGGIEEVVRLLCEGLVAHGHQVTLFAAPESESDARVVAV